MPVISILILVNSAYLGTKSIIIFELKLLRSSIYFLVKILIYALFYLDLLTSQYIPLSVWHRFLTIFSTWLVKNLLMKKIFTPVRDRSLICLRIIHSLTVCQGRIWIKSQRPELRSMDSYIQIFFWSIISIVWNPTKSET